MAGVAVLIAPVSTEFPCQQEILQGISRLSPYGVHPGQETAVPQTLSVQFPKKVTGKRKQGIGE
jgi:hypothetical protein